MCSNGIRQFLTTCPGGRFILSYLNYMLATLVVFKSLPKNWMITSQVFIKHASNTAITKCSNPSHIVVSTSLNRFHHLSTSCFPYVSHIFPICGQLFVVFLKVSLISTGSTGRWQSWMPNETACTSGKGLVDSQLGAMGNPPDVGRQWDDGN